MKWLRFAMNKAGRNYFINKVRSNSFRDQYARLRPALPAAGATEVTNTYGYSLAPDGGPAPDE
ncbi:MAG: hypothetical protein ABIU77_11445 [Ferruginibacter sp.]